jgi:hypothetical protein
VSKIKNEKNEKLKFFQKLKKLRIYFTWSFLHIKIRFIKQRVYYETDDRDHIEVYHNIQ